MLAALLLLAATAGQSAPRGEIQERLDGQPSFVFQTRKRPVDLEFCVADVLSRVANPSAFSDGPDRRIVIASEGKVIVAVELNGTTGGTNVIGHVFAKGWDDRMRERVKACL
ncbi:MAG: hypothetical protein ACM3ZV_08940 [Bacillota bacterium]